MAALRGRGRPRGHQEVQGTSVWQDFTMTVRFSLTALAKQLPARLAVAQVRQRLFKIRKRGPQQ